MDVPRHAARDEDRAFVKAGRDPKQLVLEQSQALRNFHRHDIERLRQILADPDG